MQTMTPSSYKLTKKLLLLSIFPKIMDAGTRYITRPITAWEERGQRQFIKIWKTDTLIHFLT